MDIQRPSTSMDYSLQPKHLLQQTMSKIINNSDSEEYADYSDTVSFSEQFWWW
jgi:hypothetical protein